MSVSVLAARLDAESGADGVSLFHSPGLFDGDAAPGERVGGALESNPDVVHLHQVYDPQLIDHLRAHAPVALSAHGYSACPSSVYYFRPGRECTRARGAGCVPNMLVRGCMHTRDPRDLPAMYASAGHRLEALRRADLVIAYSSAVARHLRTNGVGRQALVPLFTTMVAHEGRRPDAGRTVVFAGRLVRPKGAHVLLRAARDVDAELVLCGEGREAPALRALARRLGIEQRVAFKGWLAAEQLAVELAGASVVALPSLWPEPFGLVGIEALAAGRPVLASDTGGVSDWLQDGVSGVLVPPGDTRALARALNELLDDQPRREAMGEAGRSAVAACFSPERHVAALMDGYRAASSTWRAERGARP